jgi:hypothetical protein
MFDGPNGDWLPFPAAFSVHVAAGEESEGEGDGPSAGECPEGAVTLSCTDSGAGEDGHGYATLWKNGAATRLCDRPSCANSVFVEQAAAR